MNARGPANPSPRNWRCLIIAGALTLATTSALAQGRLVETDASMTLKGNWFDPAQCATPAGENIHLRIANSVFRIPGPYLDTVIPRKVALAKGKTAADAGKLFLQLPTVTAGCPEDPLEAPVVDLIPGTPGSDSSIRIAMWTDPSPVPTFAARLAKIRKEAQCKRIDQSDLVSCLVMEKKGQQQFAVGYMIAEDGTDRLLNGMPVHARCASIGGSILCGVSDNLNDRIGFSTTMSGDVLHGASDIRRAIETARTYVQSLDLGEH